MNSTSLKRAAESNSVELAPVSRCYTRLAADGLTVRCRATGAAETKRYDLVTERFEQWSSVGPE